MKFKKTFFITFLITYIIIGFFSQMMVQVKWDESATLLVKFLFKAKVAFVDGWSIKAAVSLICAVISSIISKD